VASEVPQSRFLTFVALLKSSLGRRFVLDGDFPGNHSVNRNNSILAQYRTGQLGSIQVEDTNSKQRKRGDRSRRALLN
jgi:hypothetical protein